MSIGAIEPGGFLPFAPPTIDPVSTPAASPISSTSPAAGPVGASAGVDFASMLTTGIERLEGLQDRADSLAVQAATGDLSQIHDYTITATEAAVSTQLTTAVRNKALEAFQEIMRISI
jgi:flagellar hook-basal body complex protein FliE